MLLYWSNSCCCYCPSIGKPLTPCQLDYLSLVLSHEAILLLGSGSDPLCSLLWDNHFNFLSLHQVWYNFNFTGWEIRVFFLILHVQLFNVLLNTIWYKQAQDLIIIGNINYSDHLMSAYSILGNRLRPCYTCSHLILSRPQIRYSCCYHHHPHAYEKIQAT